MSNKEKTKEELLKEIKILQRRGKKAGQLLIEANRRTQEVSQELKRSQDDFFNNIVQKNADGIIIVDAQGNICFVNPTCELIFDRKKEELLDVAFGFFLVPEAKEELQVTYRSGEVRTIEARTAKIFWKEKPAWLVSVRDITERKETERLKSEIIERKRINELKDEFVSTVSHELRTPLAIIKEGVSLVLDGTAGPENEQQTKLLTMVKDNIDRLVRLINNLLDISKLEAGKVEFKPVLIDFSTMLRETCAKWKIETDKNCQGLECCSPDLPINIYIDPDKLTQILDNLIANAVKFTHKQGKIKVELKDEKNQIEISVSDAGIGIAKEDLPKVFGRFQQFSRTPGAGYKGTGLGLAIVKELIEMHKGEIKVESELNKGTKFIFTLPKIAAEEIFKEYIINGLKEAVDRKSSLSLIVVHILEFSQLQEKWGEKPVYLLTDIEKVIKGSLCRKADTVLRSTGELVIPLSDTRKDDAEVVKKRIEEAIRTYLSQCKEEWIREIRITLGSATYPDEANNHQELLDKARGGGAINTKG
ncbi:MAG: ATP-binding protein [Candidatus Omnitrophota bacterium]